MRQDFHNVEPFSVGYDGPEIRVQYNAAFWNSFGLDEGRIYAHLRLSAHAPELLFEADTETGSIIREDAFTLLLKVPDAATKLMKPPSVVFDFVHETELLKRPLPGLFSWPVVLRVTRDE